MTDNEIRNILIELIDDADEECKHSKSCESCSGYGKGSLCINYHIADRLIANGVTVQKHGYLETVAEVKDNTVCGNGVKIEYKRCSCCKNPAKFFEDDFCGNCGAKLDLPQPPKGE